MKLLSFNISMFIILIILLVQIIGITAQSSNIGFKEGDQYSYQLDVHANTDGYEIGRANNSGFKLGSGNHQFNLTILSNVVENGVDIEITYNHTKYHSVSFAKFDDFDHEYFLYTTWNDYIHQLSERYKEQTEDGYKTGYKLYYKLTETEFIVKETWSSNSKPILTGSTTKNMEREVRYEKSTGIQTYYTEHSYTEADYRTFTYDYTLKRTDMVYTEISSENMVQITESSSTLGPNSFDLFLIFPLAIIISVVIIRYSLKNKD